MDAIETIPQKQGLTLERLIDRQQVMFEEALFNASYLKRPIFPVSSRAGKKTPLVQGGFKVASNNIDAVKTWWASYPGALIGLPTGQVTGLLVLDIDIKNGKNGLHALASLESKHQELPSTFSVFTPSGGYHLYFLLPPNVHIPCSVCQLGEGLDIRAEGGYVVGACSINDAWEEYKVIDDIPIAPLPTWLQELLMKPKASNEPIFLDGSIPQGKRNNNLTRILGSLRAHGMMNDDLAKMALIINQQCCKPPLSNKEALDIADSIGRRPRSFAFNQMGNAERLIERYAAVLRCLNRKDWYIWENGVWTVDVKGQAYEMAKQIALELKAEADSLAAHMETSHD